MTERIHDNAEEITEQSARLNCFRMKIDAALEVARNLVSQRIEGLEILDFDIRGRLYELALELSPFAREEESESLIAMIKLEGDENCVDIAAGTGLLTKKSCDIPEEKSMRLTRAMSSFKFYIAIFRRYE